MGLIGPLTLNVIEQATTTKRKECRISPFSSGGKFA
jgi:hypothetical protein